MTKQRKPTDDENTKRLMEAIAGCIGAVLALGTVAVIVWHGINGDGGPPVIVVESQIVHAVENGFVLELAIANRGNATATQVLVEGTLASGGEIVETSEATFDYVPSRSRRTGGLFFAADPRTHDVAVRAKGYTDP
jgi:uncharacterized protein (TIGR02588 family)